MLDGAERNDSRLASGPDPPPQNQQASHYSGQYEIFPRFGDVRHWGISGVTTPLECPVQDNHDATNQQILLYQEARGLALLDRSIVYQCGKDGMLTTSSSCLTKMLVILVNDFISTDR